MVDLGGRTMVPGFIDSHGHVSASGFDGLVANLRPPPDGEGSDIPSLIRITHEWVATSPKIVDAYGWIMGYSYDDSELTEKRHPTADELDQISTTLPVMFVHASGHLGVLNHKALEVVGITESTEDPVGGVIQRVPGTRTPNGVLEETAWLPIMLGSWAAVGDEGAKFLTKRGIENFVRNGFTTAEDARSSIEGVAAMRRMAAAGEIPIDVIAYPDIEMAGADWLKTAGDVSRAYDGHFRVAGVKLCLDGSPQGRTAWLTQPYEVPPPGLPADYRGYPAIPDDNVVEGYVESAFVNDWQMVVHDNGDAAIDQFLRVVGELTAQYGPKDRRPVAIHAQVTRDDQLDTMKALGVIPTFFATHTFYWGDWHTEQVLGEPRADNISPSGSARRRDMVFTIHNDAPAVPPDAMMLLSAAVNRVTRSGRVIGPDQRISAYDGLRALTIWGAYQHFEENAKGTITVGKLADFAILDSNPVKGDPMRIRDINVVETIKEGNTVFRLT